MYVCLCACVCVCMYVYMCIHVCRCMCVCVCVSLCVYKICSPSFSPSLLHWSVNLYTKEHKLYFFETLLFFASGPLTSKNLISNSLELHPYSDRVWSKEEALGGTGQSLMSSSLHTGVWLNGFILANH